MYPTPRHGSSGTLQPAASAPLAPQPGGAWPVSNAPGGRVHSYQGPGASVHGPPRTPQDQEVRPVPAVDPQYSGPPRLEPMYGPYLRFGGYDPATHTYSASVMMIIHQTLSPYPPHLHYYRRLQAAPDQVGPKITLDNPLLLWSYTGYNFWRWDIQLQLTTALETVNYWVSCSDPASSPRVSYNFHLPSSAQKWHWGFYSCNGFHDHADEVMMGGIQPLWRDVMNVHSRDPLHVMFGGGDQLYCDDVWKMPSLEQWTRIQDKPSRNAHPFSQNMVNETFDFYFRQYTTHFGKDVFRDALASIPQVMIWDDHDIFDGWGSYPPELQNCHVFTGIFSVARRFYLLFQWHANLDNFRQLNQGWGLTGLSYIYMLGSSTAVVGLDSRGERTRSQIIQPASWAAFAHQVARLPAGVRHVVVLATVPVVYPVIPGVEWAMQNLADTGVMTLGLQAFLQKTGLSHHIYSQFGEPELLDDLLDHWSAECHEGEKKAFLRIMQDLARARNFRFTLLSGDVHCASMAVLQTMPKMDPRTDHRYMIQVISSAIGNVPPPDGVITTLSLSNRIKMVDNVTREKILRKFENNTVLKASRNWCDVHERPLPGDRAGVPPSAWGHPAPGVVSSGPDDGALHFQLRVEKRGAGHASFQMYDIDAPRLEMAPGSFSVGPLAAAPQLPPGLAEKFEAQRAQGYGLEMALPPPPLPPRPAAAGSGRRPSTSSLRYEPGASQQPGGMPVGRESGSSGTEPSAQWQQDSAQTRRTSAGRGSEDLQSALERLQLQPSGSSSLIYPNLVSSATPDRGISYGLPPPPSAAAAAAAKVGSSSDGSRRPSSFSGGSYPPPVQAPGARLPSGESSRPSSAVHAAYPHLGPEPTAPPPPLELDLQGLRTQPPPPYSGYAPPTTPYGSGHNYAAPYPGQVHGPAAAVPYTAGGHPQPYYSPPAGGAPYYPAPSGHAPGVGYAPPPPGPYGGAPPLPTQYPYGSYPANY